MSVSGTSVTTYYDGFPKAHPSLPPSTRRSGRGVVHRRTLVEYRRSRPNSSPRVVGSLGARNLFTPPTRTPPRYTEGTRRASALHCAAALAAHARGRRGGERAAAAGGGGGEEGGSRDGSRAVRQERRGKGSARRGPNALPAGGITVIQDADMD